MTVIALKMLLMFAILAMAVSSRASLPGKLWHNRIIAPLVRFCLKMGRLKITRGHMLLALGLAGIFALAIWLAGGDGLNISAMALPEVTTWAMTFEISTLLDAMATVMIVSATVRIRALTGLFSALLQRRLRDVHRRAPRSQRRQETAWIAANDDEDPQGVLLAA